MAGLTRNSKRARFAGLTLMVAVAAVWAIMVLRRADHRPGRPADAATAGDSVPLPARDVLDMDTLTSEASSDVALRSASPSRLRILSKDGNPIEAVRGTWVPLASDWFEQTVAWPALDWTRLAKRSRVLSSDANGVMTIDGLPDDDTSMGSVLWLSHPQFVAASIPLTFPAAPLKVPSEVTLEPSAGLRARVIGSDGAPVPGAEVVTMPDLSRDEAHVEGDNPRQVDFVLRSTAVSDSAGHAVLTPLPGNQFVFATLDGRRSEPWTGVGSADIVLKLQSTFSIGGRVEFGTHAPFAADLRVKCSIRRGITETIVDRVPVRPDGTWGSAQLPVVECDSYVFRLRGGSIAEEVVFRTPPQPGENVTVDFHPIAGLDVAVRVTDAAGVDLQDAVVSAHWLVDGEWNSIVTRSRADGIARVRNCLPGTIWIRARKPGFALKTVGELVVTEPPAEPIRVSLDRAGVIEGRCVHADAPVRDFTILFRRPAAETHDQLVVKDSADGSFRIDEAPLGDVILVATSNEFPRATPQIVNVVSDQPSNVTLEFPDVMTGKGRVVDGLTGEPIRDASVQVQVLYPQGRIKLRPWKTAQRVDAQGGFEIRGFVEGENEIEVAAPGYANRAVIRIASADTELDFGAIALFAKQSLRVRLHSQSAEDYSGYRASLEGGDYFPERPFSASGTVEFAGLATGVYSLSIIYPDTSLRYEMVRIEAGADVEWDVILHTKPITFEVLPDPDTEPLPWYLLMLNFTNQQSEWSTHNYVVTPGVPLQVDDIVGTRLVVTVRDTTDAQNTLAVREVPLEPTWPSTVQIQLIDRPLTIRVVSATREPISGTRVILMSSDTTTAWNEQLTTDANGECVVNGLDLDNLLVALYHPDYGMRPCASLEGSRSGARTVELVLNPKNELRVVALERTTPAVGVELEAKDIRGVGWGLGRVHTNDHGVAKWGPFEDGDLQVRVRHPGFWPTEQRVPFTGAREAVPMQVRRLGSVEITAKNAYGSAAANVAVDLYSVEQQQWVSEWIRTRLVAGSSTGMRTDDEGRLRVHGLPNGEFRWRATSSTGNVVEGTVQVPPQGVAQLPIAVQ